LAIATFAAKKSLQIHFMTKQFPHYDIDSVLSENTPLEVMYWFHNNMPYGCAEPEPDEAMMFPEERVPRDIHQLTTYVPNGFSEMIYNNDNIDDLYRGMSALEAIGAEDAAKIVREVIAIADSFGLRELVKEGKEAYYALSSEDQEQLEEQLDEIDSKIRFLRHLGGTGIQVRGIDCSIHSKEH